MKSVAAVQQELRKVRKCLAQRRKDGIESGDLWWAQQTLIWVLGDGKSPSQVEAMINKFADTTP